MAYCCSGYADNSNPEKKDRRMLIIGVVAGVLILGGITAGVISSNGGSSGDQSGTPKIQIDQEKFDFGDVSMANGKISKIIQIKNEGDGDLKLSNIYTSCMCTTVTVKIDGKKSPSFGMRGHGQTFSFWEEALGPGQTADLDVIFDPNAHGPDATGPITRAIYIHSNDNNQGDTQSAITFTANVTK
jgi:hypothetical protein